MRLKKYIKEAVIGPDVKILEFPELRQTYNYDCGASALQSVLQYYGIDEREGQIMKLLNIKNDGADIPELIKVAEHFGITVEAKEGMTILDLVNAIDNKYPVLVEVQAFPDEPYDLNWRAGNEYGHYCVCFTKDTKISLLDGRSLNFEELINEFSDKQFWVYSYDIENKKIVPGLAHSPRKTKFNQKIIEIELDNGKKIKCTENHPFLLRNGKYVNASKLKMGESLMPLYKKMDNYGYEMVLDVTTKKWKYTHRLDKNYNNLKEYRNDNDGNIGFQKWTYEMFSKNNKENAIKYEYWKRLNTPEARKKKEETIKNLLINNSDFKKMKKDVAIKNWKKYNEMIKMGEIELTQNQKTARRMNALKLCYNKWYKDKFSTFDEYYEYKLNNHKVINIKYLEQKEDVYDITVEKYHNFALSSGVFVHNCIGYDKENIYFEDPASIKRTYMSFKEMNERWHGYGESDKIYNNWGMICKGVPNYKVNDVEHFE